ncbi:MAG: serine--tRNA ligase [Kiritimatiellia bacterium]
MLDIRRIREQKDQVLEALRARGLEPDLDAILKLDDERRACIGRAETLKNERNRDSKEIGALIKTDPALAATKKEAVRLKGEEISALDRRAVEAEAARDALVLALPNTPHPAVGRGTDSTHNKLVRTFGTPRTFDFTPRPQWELGEALGIFDFKRAAKISGAGFPLLVGPGARIARGLVQFMLDLHTREHGYTEVEPPFVVNSDSVLGTGQLPKFPEEMYRVPEDDLWLIPTAEVPVTNIHRDEILEGPLPVKYTAYSPCFRREAGAAGKMTRGMNRVHQFDKVELVKFADPATSYDELESLTRNAEAVLQKLDLHYRVIELCTGDMGFASAKTYDIELWAPGQNAWLEVSSCSNFEDYQARRMRIRYRDADGKPALVHTLNGSGVALPRLIIAILENGQQADGSVVLPGALRPYVGGLERIVPRA